MERFLHAAYRWISGAIRPRGRYGNTRAIQRACPCKDVATPKVNHTGNEGRNDQLTESTWSSSFCAWNFKQSPYIDGLS